MIYDILGLGAMFGALAFMAVAMLGRHNRNDERLLMIRRLS